VASNSSVVDRRLTVAATPRAWRGKTRTLCATSSLQGGYRQWTRLLNETEEDVIYLELGDRTPGDEGNYPDDDFKTSMADGKWKFVHKDGSPYV
jgi:hypothetical protein